MDRNRHYTQDHPCLECYGWGLPYSTCSNDKYFCATCGRPQCLLHWRYPIQTREEAIHFLKGAEVCTGKKCFVREAKLPTGLRKWKIFTSERDYESYMKSKKHLR
jgi:hypothetical protein